jgi:hypothetical protein
LVPATGGVNSAFSKNIGPGNVSHPSTGVYCISGIPGARNTIANLDNSGNGFFALVSIPGQAPVSCPGGTQFEVDVLDGNGSPTDSQFQISVN